MKRLLSPLALALSLLCCSALLQACEPETEIVAATQVTVRVYAADEVRERWAHLRLRAYRDDDGEFKFRAVRTYKKEDLGEIVDVVLAPASGVVDRTILVVVDAIDEDGVVLVQARATFEYVPREQRTLEMWLYPCELRALGELCSEVDCIGDACLTCVNNRCEPTPHYDPPDLTKFDPKDPGQPKPPEWLDAGPGSDGGLDACVGSRCGPMTDADPPADSGVDSAVRDASVDGGLDANTGPSDAGADSASPMDGGQDAGSDAGRDGGLDAGTDAGSDAGTDAGRDAGTDAGQDSGLSMVGRCAVWTTRTPRSALPANAPQLASHGPVGGTPIPQFICRLTTPDGVLTPGKLNQNIGASTPTIDFSCFPTYLMGGVWVDGYDEGETLSFEVLTPPSDCVLTWVSVAAGGALPARALPTGGTVSAPLYSCRIPVSTSMPDNVARSGTHMGRLSPTGGDICHVQYYGGSWSSATYEVLVQSN